MTFSAEQEIEALFGVDLAIAVLEMFEDVSFHIVGFDASNVFVGTASENVAFSRKTGRVTERFTKVASKMSRKGIRK